MSLAFSNNNIRNTSSAKEPKSNFVCYERRVTDSSLRNPCHAFRRQFENIRRCSNRTDILSSDVFHSNVRYIRCARPQRNDMGRACRFDNKEITPFSAHGRTQAGGPNMISKHRSLLVKIAQALLFVIIALAFWHQTPVKAILISLVGIAFVIALSIYPQRRVVWCSVLMFMIYFISDSDLIGWSSALGMSTLVAVIMGLVMWACDGGEKSKPSDGNDKAKA